MDSGVHPIEVTVTEAKQLLARADRTVEVIDVREPDELQICAITGAKHIPMRQIPEAVPTLSKDKHFLVLCHHGGRSMRVTQFLRAQGFTNVTNIAGGIDAWADEIEPGMRKY